MRGALALALLLAGCGRAGPATHAASVGDGLETAALASGLVVDPAAGSLVGSWALDTDRACIIAGRSGGASDRIGVAIDYGEGQACAASGTVRREGGGLDVRLGDCRVHAGYDGERISFPAAVPAPCERLCTGRATLAAMTVERISESASEAATLRSPGGRLLCAG